MAGYSKSNDGHITNPHGDYDMWIIKVDSNGQLVWQKSYGGSAEDRALKVIENSDGDYLVAGFTKSNDGDISHYSGNDKDLLANKN